MWTEHDVSKKSVNMSPRVHQRGGRAQAVRCRVLEDSSFSSTSPAHLPLSLASSGDVIRYPQRDARCHAVVAHEITGSKGANVLHAYALSLIIMIEPIPWIGFSIILTSKRGVSLAWWFLAGWLASNIVVDAVIWGFAGKIPSPGTLAPGAWFFSVEVLAGAALLVWMLRRRHRPAVQHQRPKWMAGVDSMNSVASCLIGFLIAPWPVMAAVAAIVVSHYSRTGARLAMLAWLAFFGLIPYIVVVINVTRRPDVWRRRLESLREWIEDHQPIVLQIVAFALAAYLIVNGLVGLIPWT